MPKNWYIWYDIYGIYGNIFLCQCGLFSLNDAAFHHEPTGHNPLTPCPPGRAKSRGRWDTTLVPCVWRPQTCHTPFDRPIPQNDLQVDWNVIAPNRSLLWFGIFGNPHLRNATFQAALFARFSRFSRDVIWHPESFYGQKSSNQHA